MTTRPRLQIGRQLLPGLAAVGLFIVLLGFILQSSFDEPRGFPAEASIIENIGYALLDLHTLTTIDVAGFLVAFIAIAVVLDAALSGAVMLATRDEDNDGGNE